MKQLTTLIIFIFSSITINAQLDSFKLSDYKLPFIKRHELDFTFLLNGEKGDDVSLHNNNNNISTNFSFYSNLKAEYEYLFNSKKNQREGNIFCSLNSSVTSNTRHLVQNSQNLSNSSLLHNFNSYYDPYGYYVNLSTSNAMRAYLINNFFADFLIKINSSYSDSYNSNNPSNYSSVEEFQSRSIQKQMDVNPKIGMGYGRIEPVQDARLSIYILEDLNNLHLLKREPRKDEIMQFAELISTIQNKRFFDSRIRKMEEIQAVDSFLQSKDLITYPNAKYFTSVNDNWSNSANPVRFSGCRVTVDISPELNYNNSQNNRIVRDNTTRELNAKTTRYTFIDNYLMAVIGFSYYKPINNFWQYGSNVNFEYGFLFTKSSGTSTNLGNVNYKEVRAEIRQSIGFYPNSRTSIVLSLDGTANNTFDPSDRDYDRKSLLTYTPYLNLSMNYYFSQKLRFQVNYSLFYSYYKPDNIYNFNKQENQRQLLRCSILYSLF